MEPMIKNLLVVLLCVVETAFGHKALVYPFAPRRKGNYDFLDSLRTAAPWGVPKVSPRCTPLFGEDNRSRLSSR